MIKLDWREVCTAQSDAVISHQTKCAFILLMLTQAKLSLINTALLSVNVLATLKHSNITVTKSKLIVEKLSSKFLGMHLSSLEGNPLTYGFVPCRAYV